MTHVFVAPHPDDAALSCGGLIASLRATDQDVTILTVFSGSGADVSLTPYQREALGFGSKAEWRAAEALNRGGVRADGPLDAGCEPLMDDVPRREAVPRAELDEARLAGDLMATRRLEDERYAHFSGASIVFLDLPDAVFRGYEGDEQLLAAPRADDRAPVDLLVQEITRLEPQKLYLPLGIGDHVDHQLTRTVGVTLLQPRRRRLMPGPEYAGSIAYYEDFPYAWWSDFRGLGDLPAGAFDGLPPDVGLTPEYADITDVVERKVLGLGLYGSQMDRLFGGRDLMGDAVRGYGTKVASLGGQPGFAERYWASSRL